MGMSQELFKKALPIWDRIVEHPFVVELYEGTLPLEKFRYYAVQDYNYLVTMMRVFSILASKSTPNLAREALEIAHADATTEMRNYEELLGKLGLSLEEVVATPPAPTNVSYMSYMLSTCSLGGPAECLAVVLPCFWSYEYIAERHKEKLSSNPSELYREWARVYLETEYKAVVERLRRALDEVTAGLGGERLRVLEEIFMTASRYEYMFWDMAYRMEEWPV